MRQNRKRANSKQTSNYLQSLNENLMTKISSASQNNSMMRSTLSKITTNMNNNNYDKNKTLYKQQHVQDLEIINLTSAQKPLSNILQRAKNITSSKKLEIQKAKKACKQSKKQTQANTFLTGCGLYDTEQNNQPQYPENEQIDMNEALKYLVLNEKDDLQELRRMINKTNRNLNEYSGEIYDTQTTVMNAADIYGTDINIQLKMKINKCKLQDKRKSIDSGKNQITKRKISTSHQNSRRKAPNNFVGKFQDF